MKRVKGGEISAKQEGNSARGGSKLVCVAYYAYMGALWPLTRPSGGQRTDAEAEMDRV